MVKRFPLRLAHKWDRNPGMLLLFNFTFKPFLADLYEMVNSKLLIHKENQKLIMIVKEQQMQKILVN